MSRRRFRSPTFSTNEVQTLINIIERHKYTILNKATNSTVNQAKEVSWEKITKIFNSRGFKYERSIDSLKTKWENLKREARKLSKNVIDVSNGVDNDLTRQIVSMICDVENNAPAELSQDVDDNDDFQDTAALNDEKLSENLKRKSYWESCEEKNSDDSNDGDDERRSNRSLNFAPQECSLLLECVRKEKNIVFSKEYSAHAVAAKNKAWKRITDVFNKKSPQKRSQRVLRTKFNNMKTIAKSIGAKDALKNFDIKIPKHEKLVNESSKKIKSEPVFEVEIDNGADDDDDDDHHSDSNHHYAPDPLTTILNSDSGIGSTRSSSWSQENKEVEKLKKELLNYQMETARLERQKVEEAKQAEAAAIEARSVETSLRLRAARLEAVAAAMKLPPDHPALLITPEELPAEKYLREYEHT